jgi:hypothetical protein
MIGLQVVLADVDVLTHSPDGEPRGLLFRVGDIYPMDPAPHHRSGIGESASAARPWGMRHLRLPSMQGGGKHESDTAEFTTGPDSRGDGQNPEDWDTD